MAPDRRCSNRYRGVGIVVHLGAVNEAAIGIEMEGTSSRSP